MEFQKFSKFHFKFEFRRFIGPVRWRGRCPPSPSHPVLTDLNTSLSDVNWNTLSHFCLIWSGLVNPKLRMSSKFENIYLYTRQKILEHNILNLHFSKLSITFCAENIKGCLKFAFSLSFKLSQIGSTVSVTFRSHRVIMTLESHNEFRIKSVFFQPSNLWVDFLRIGTRYQKTDFCRGNRCSARVTSAPTCGLRHQVPLEF